MHCVTVYNKETEQVDFFWWLDSISQAFGMRDMLEKVIDADKYELYIEHEQHTSNYSHAAGYQN